MVAVEPGTQVQISALPLSTCLITGKLLRLSVLQREELMLVPRA